MNKYQVTYKERKNNVVHERTFETKQLAKWFIQMRLKGNKFYTNRRLKKIKGE